MKAFLAGALLGAMIYSLPIAGRYATTIYELVFTEKNSLTDQAVDDAMKDAFVWWLRDFLGPRYEEWRQHPSRQHLFPAWAAAVAECDRVVMEARRVQRASALEACYRENERRAGGR